MGDFGRVHYWKLGEIGGVKKKGSNWKMGE